MLYKKMGRFQFLQENGAGSRFKGKWANSILTFDKLVFVIIPKGEVFLNAVGVKLSEKVNPIRGLLNLDFR